MGFMSKLCRNMMFRNSRLWTSFSLNKRNTSNPSWDKHFRVTCSPMGTRELGQADRVGLSETPVKREWSNLRKEEAGKPFSLCSVSLLACVFLKFLPCQYTQKYIMTPYTTETFEQLLHKRSNVLGKSIIYKKESHKPRMK